MNTIYISLNRGIEWWIDFPFLLSIETRFAEINIRVKSKRGVFGVDPSQLECEEDNGMYSSEEDIDSSLNSNTNQYVIYNAV